MRLLSVNIYFDPDSFGGATIVAEHMAHQLDARAEFQMTAISARLAQLPTISITRYKTRFGFDGFSVGMPYADKRTDSRRIANPLFDQALRTIVDVVRPDAVHVHCVQDLGASFFDILVDAGIPFAVTVHDFWWLCARQFMIDPNGDYCGQTEIDYKKCARFCGDHDQIKRRGIYLIGQLAKADLILTPSDFTKQMLVANGIRPDKITVNRNGVMPPVSEFSDTHEKLGETEVRFGFVGGPGPIKGWDLIKAAFSGISSDKAKVLAVDAGKLIGQPWREDLEAGWRDAELEIIPGYTGETLDEAFSHFDVLLAPARWKETFGLVVREALIRDIWVIASDAGGLSEDIIDGKNGTLLPFPPSVADLKAAVLDRLKPDAPRFSHVVRINTVADQADELAKLLSDMVSDKLTSNKSS